jgi:hypothetical protein
LDFLRRGITGSVAERFGFVGFASTGVAKDHRPSVETGGF